MPSQSTKLLISATFLCLLLQSGIAHLVEAKGADKNTLLLETKCQQLISDKKAGEAIPLIDRAIKENPRDATLVYTKAQVLEAKKDVYGAVKALTRAIELRPDYPEAYLMRARGYAFLGEMEFSRDYEKNGVADLDSAIRLKPNYATAHDYKGILLASKGRYREAIDSFTKAIASDSHEVKYFEHRAMAYNVLGDKSKALFDLSEAVRLEPLSYCLLLNLAEQLDAMGHTSKARECFDRAIALKPKNVNLINRRAQFFLKHEYYKEAVVDASKILTYSPDDDDALVMRGGAYVGLKQYDKALSDYDRAIKLSPALAAHYNLRAKLHRLMKQDGLAKEDEAQALRLSQIKF